MSEVEKKSKILIVDDVSANRLMMTEILKINHDYQIATASSGMSALSKMKAHKFDLVLLDIMMPEMDGFEVCQRIKADINTRSIPVIFLTAVKDKDSIVRGFKMGAVDYIPKPFSKEELLARVKLHIELKHTQEELESAKDLAEAAANAKSLFLANMSHEIRTPMNGIVGMIDIMEQTKLSEDQNEYLDIIKISSENLLNIINDILDFSKIEAGQIDFENIKFNIWEEIDAVSKLLSFKAREKNLDLSFKIDNNVPHFISGDPTRLKQVIINLLNNALKFTQKGGVSINVGFDKEFDDRVKLIFKIIDSGIGISEENQKKLFKSFSQTDASTTRKYGGTGLGLAISKSLTSLMNGDIGVESAEGEGSTFWFTAIFDIAKDDTEIEKDNIDGEDYELGVNLRVLLAEDNLVIQKVAAFCFEKMGCILDIVGNGKLAVEHFKENKYDIIFTDIQMPELDGIDATKQIRDIEQEKGVLHHIPIVAMTANTMKGDRERFLEVGMDDYISKPFKPEQLYKLLKRMLKLFIVIDK